MKIALREDMAEEQGVVKGADLVVGGPPLRLVLEREDGAVAGGVASREDCRQFALPDPLAAGSQRRRLHVLRSRTDRRVGGDCRQQ